MASVKPAERDCTLVAGGALTPADALSDAEHDVRSTGSSLSDVHFGALWNDVDGPQGEGAIPFSSPASAVTHPASVTWTPADSTQLYNVDGWGCGYFSISDSGTLCVHPMAGIAP